MASIIYGFSFGVLYALCWAESVERLVSIMSRF